MSEIELLPDPTPILTLSPDEPEVDYTEEEQFIKEQKERALKCKVIALSRMGHHPISANVSSFNKKSKTQLLTLVKQLFTQTDEEINIEFNDICLEVVFDDKEDITKYPVYTKTYKIDMPKIPVHSVMDSRGNIIYFGGDEPTEEIKQKGVYKFE
jgi:hypothetical protein